MQQFGNHKRQNNLKYQDATRIQSPEQSQDCEGPGGLRILQYGQILWGHYNLKSYHGFYSSINSSCKSWGIVNFLTKQNCQKGYMERS